MASADLLPNRDVWTVSRLNREVRSLLESGLPLLWIEGEISNIARPSSGHVYFSLKDANAQVRCAMWRQRSLGLEFKPDNGDQVLVRARVGLYEARGDYQLIVDHMEPAGEGALRLKFEQLKRTLADQGLFDEAHKKALPGLPERIGVITSPSGAAVRDVLHILRKRFPAIPVIVYPVPVQGDGAAAQIAAMLQTATERGECDVLILTRGGGSLEDLWAFNEEILARAIFDCDIPVISAVGHEIDFTIADFVADVRAPTPSGAAELAVPDQDDWLRRIVSLASRLSVGSRRQLDRCRELLGWQQRQLARLHPGQTLRQQTQRLDELEQRIYAAQKMKWLKLHRNLDQQRAWLMRLSPAAQLERVRATCHALRSRLESSTLVLISRKHKAFDLANRALQAMSPHAVLDRGYAIVTKDDAVISDASQVSPDDLVVARLARGSISARVETTRKKT